MAFNRAQLLAVQDQCGPGVGLKDQFIAIAVLHIDIERIDLVEARLNGLPVDVAQLLECLLGGLDDLVGSDGAMILENETLGFFSEELAWVARVRGQIEGAGVDRESPVAKARNADERGLDVTRRSGAVKASVSVADLVCPGSGWLDRKCSDDQEETCDAEKAGTRCPWKNLLR